MSREKITLPKAVGHTQTPSNGDVATWEYLVLDRNQEDNATMLAALLMYGAQSWELVTIVRHPNGCEDFWLKRPLK